MLLDPLTFQSLVVIVSLPGEERESVGGQIFLSREEGIFSTETVTVEETQVKSRQGNKREVNWKFDFRQFSRLIGHSSLDKSSD